MIRPAMAAVTGAAGLLVLTGAGTLLSGQVSPSEETRLLREAAALESRGDFEGAEGALRRLLQASPTSSGGLFAMERVLRARGVPRALLPLVDDFLENDPSAAGVRYLKLRVLSELDSLGALEGEAEEWFRADPGAVGPYREVARVYERAFGSGRALELLRQGRRASGDPSALGLEIGDLLAGMGDELGAAEEWARAVDDAGSQGRAVSRRIQGLSGDRAAAGARLVEALASGGSRGRRRAAVEIALDLGLEERALGLSREVAAGLEERQRANFLSEVARRAEEAGMSALARWALAELGHTAASPGERRQFDIRLVDVFLAAGDTVDALQAQRRVASSFTPGSVDRRRAMARVVTLEASRGDGEAVVALLDRFRGEYPEAPELDDLGATVARALHRAGDPDAAAEALSGIDGPRSSIERAYLLLDRGMVREAAQSLLIAVSGLAPSAATDVIQLAGLLGRVTPESGEVLAVAGVLSHRGDGAGAARTILAAVEGLPPEEQASVLAEGARMAERGGDLTGAAGLRHRILDEHPDAGEVGDAAMELARYRASRPDGVRDAIEILETLIMERPNAAVVPGARRMLERLRREVGS
ncbi:MAG: hypothetical protein OEZ65_08965 [Gemmatimonadota bacterium]|nr:hypothetical protein [Gemmatimonadota bacterium]MDH5759705.1 hypothetical protein [Gemmatimonadota bacterium]